MQGTDRYLSFNHYLRRRFGCRVQRISLDAGFGCPNRDGTVGHDGCIFCNNEGFSAYRRREEVPALAEQIKRGIRFGRERYKARKFIAYFQSYTNTYAAVPALRAAYDHIRGSDDIVGLAVGTRPDCIDRQRLLLLDEYAKQYEVWIEYGVQSVHESTLQRIRRGHSFAATERAIALTKEFPRLKVCAHVIIGLPGETGREVLQTAQELARLGIDGVKIHPLHVMRDTALEQLFREGQYRMMERDVYIAQVCSFLEELPPEVVVQRLHADCRADLLVGPEWIADKQTVVRGITEELRRRGTRQGARCGRIAKERA